MLIATFGLESSALVLAEAFQRLPQMRVKSERVAAHSPSWTMPGLWVTNVPFDEADAAFESDPSVDTIIESEEFSNSKYYHVEWVEEVNQRVEQYLDKQASLLAVQGTSDGWRTRIRFVSREQFDTFRDNLHDKDLDFQLLELTDSGAPPHSGGSLTSGQRTALIAAREQGYYNIPQEVTVQELAASLEKSHQTVSELLRRGTQTLIDRTLLPEDDETGPF